MKRRWLLILTLGSLVLGTISAGIYFKHYFVVSVFAVWIFIEFLLSRFPITWRRSSRDLRFKELLTLYARFTRESLSELEDKMTSFKLGGNLTPYQERWLDRLRCLVRLRSLLFNEQLGRRGRVEQAFIYKKQTGADSEVFEASEEKDSPSISLQDITEAATNIADLYWKLFESCLGQYPELNKVARSLYFEVFNVRFHSEESRESIERLTDSMQRDRGIPFFILNLVGKRQWSRAKALTQALLQDINPEALNEETRAALYWVSEIQWFSQQSDLVVSDFESCVRYLYHLCFVNPERAGFLEVDSQFLSQFEVISELAREGFLFKELLFEKILILWKDHEGFFEDVFKNVFENMTQQKSKIYDERSTWEKLWKRLSENFVRDYLYVVEGNICYANHQYEDASQYYEKALSVNKWCRPALLNLLFCYGRLGETEKHERLVQRILQDRSFGAAVLHVIGDSYLIVGDEATADSYYTELRKNESWDRKLDYYVSTFCFENGLHDKALEFAHKAYEKNPNDSAVRYHLSVCYNAVGEKDRALDMISQVGEHTEWLKYYKFTLQRDMGNHHEASETLLRIPTDYFQDPEELAAAVDFAKDRRDIVLLKHLRKKI